MFRTSVFHVLFDTSATMSVAHPAAGLIQPGNRSSARFPTSGVRKIAVIEGTKSAGGPKNAARGDSG